jgi:hypothetical protein|tara:strand:+ start:40 stop:1902 length:1863 start_codon:yes stop_codon:yes gene_type:complete
MNDEEDKPNIGGTVAGVGFETAAGIATDIATKPLLAVPPVYALANFVSGSVANAIAQRLRGEKGINLGEVLSSGAVGIIPGSTIKTGKNLSKVVGKAGSIKRAAVSGGLQGVGAEAIRVGIDEQRLINAKEAFLGGATGGVASAGMQRILEAAPSALNKFVDTFTPGPLRIARDADLIGAAKFGATSSGTKRLTSGEIQQLNLQDKAVTDSYTQKFKPQPWELSSNITDEPMRDRMFLQTTGRRYKLDKPAPKNTGEDFGLIPDKARGKPFRTMKKQDINLSEFTWGPKTINASVNRFRRRIMGLMQVDRIRSTDAGTADGFSKTSTNINSVTKGTDEVSSMYFDYLVGYFNRFIRPGKVSNFKNAVDLISPKMKGGKRVPKELQITKGGVGLIRELRLFTMAPDVYKSGAFKTTDKTYQAKLKNLIRRYSTVGAPKETFNKKTGLYDYKFDAHHIDQIAEGWVLYRGLPKEEIPKMRRLIQAYGLEPGNHPDNVLLLLNRNHVRYHKKYWPEAKAKLINDKSTPWDPEAMVKIKTAAGRNAYVANYVQAIEESRDRVLEEIEQELSALAAKKNKAIEDLTRADIDSISDELDILDPSDPLDRSSKAPKDIQDQIDKDSK